MAMDVASREWVGGNRKNSFNNQPTSSGEEPVKSFSYDAEQAVLGGIILDPQRFESVAASLKTEDFYYKEHRIIFDAMLKLSESGYAIDIVSLQTEIEKGQHTDDVNAQYLMTLQRIVPNTIDMRAYAKTIIDKSKARRLADICKQVLDNIYFPRGQEIGDILDKAESLIFRINDEASHDGTGPVPMSRVMYEVTKNMQENIGRKKGDISGISTGYPDLDGYLSGFHGGELIIVAARPAMGKTTFAMNLVENIAMNPANNKPVLVFSLEMPSSQIATRLIASMGRIDQSKLRNYTLETEDWTNVAAVVAKMHERSNSMFIDDTSGLTPMELRTRARRIARDYGGLSAIMVDYLQLMRAPGFDNARNLEVGECSRSLKALAKELNIPVIALAQLNRGLEGRKDKRPMNADLRESGSIEQDADVIMFVHREEVYNQTDASLKGKAEIIIGKQRNGPIGTVNLVFLNQYSRFESCQFSGNPEYQ